MASCALEVRARPRSSTSGLAEGVRKNWGTTWKGGPAEQSTDEHATQTPWNTRQQKHTYVHFKAPLKAYSWPVGRQKWLAHWRRCSDACSHGSLPHLHVSDARSVHPPEHSALLHGGEERPAAAASELERERGGGGGVTSCRERLI